jgi:hypothetical protein
VEQKFANPCSTGIVNALAGYCALIPNIKTGTCSGLRQMAGADNWGVEHNLRYRTLIHQLI